VFGRGLFIALIFVLTVEIGFVQFKASAQPRQNSANQEQSKPNQNPQSTASPATAPQSQAQTEVPHAGSPDNQRQESQQSSYDYSAWFTSWIQAIIAILLFVWVVRQTRIADQQRKIMQKQIETTDLIERGYMGIADMTIGNLVVGGRPTVTIKWVNGGRTPVRNFRAMPIVVFGWKPVSKKMYFIDDDVSPISGSFFPVGAEREVKYEVTDRIDADEWFEFERGKSNLYIIGNFVYRDITGEERKERISAMYNRREDFIYETYAYSEPHDQD
jgi:hypothetical protein